MLFIQIGQLFTTIWFRLLPIDYG